MLGEQTSKYYPFFWFKDDLVQKKMRSFVPVGNYYFLHGNYEIVPLRVPVVHKNQTQIEKKQAKKALRRHIKNIYKLLAISPKDQTGEGKRLISYQVYNFLTSKMFGASWKPVFDYIFWFSFAKTPMIEDHYMTGYLEGLGNFSSKLSLVNYPNLCVDANLTIVYCNVETYNQFNDKIIPFYDNSCKLHWSLTGQNQFENQANKRCLHIEWRKDLKLNVDFIPTLTLTENCNKDITKFDYSSSDFKIRTDAGKVLR